jgi:4-hydroxybutyryl-CoA dehydratase/vinylacetyl-CoA-Delta-isomerase
MVYEWMRIAQDIAGGKIITLPAEMDLANPEVGKMVEECFYGKDGIAPMDIIKMLRLIENMSVGAGLPEAMHGAGSPAAQKIMISRRSGIDKKMELAKRIAGLSPDTDFERIIGKSEEAHWDQVRQNMKEKKVQIY